MGKATQRMRPNGEGTPKDGIRYLSLICIPPFDNAVTYGGVVHPPSQQYCQSTMCTDALASRSTDEPSPTKMSVSSTSCPQCGHSGNAVVGIDVLASRSRVRLERFKIHLTLALGFFFRGRPIASQQINTVRLAAGAWWYSVCSRALPKLEPNRF